jgi:ribosomal protein L37E
MPPFPIDDSPEQPMHVPLRCSRCGFPMFLSLIEPSETVDHDQRTFECSACTYAETITTKIRE